ncbi:ABC transporter substrate-binding protein, partial [Pseudomonas aeruginosa]|nr:ABC transporter substrate-binding protein [Pseudomonas aeruginosa]
MSSPFLRRLAIWFAASVVLSCIVGAQAEEVLSIGFPKSSTLLTLISSQG